MELFKMGVQAPGMQNLGGKKTQPLRVQKSRFWGVVAYGTCGKNLGASCECKTSYDALSSQNLLCKF